MEVSEAEQNVEVKRNHDLGEERHPVVKRLREGLTQDEESLKED
jgi:hypothetical protein